MIQEQEQRRSYYDKDLKIEAYNLSGVVQKFPNHFHKYYVIGFVEVCALNIFGKNSQYFWQNILGKWELEIVIFKPPFLPLILRILL